MAGYRDDYSKSNNAWEAEQNGLFPASTLAKRLGVQTKAIKELMRASEWHHSSKYYNPVDYYSESDAIEILEALQQYQKPLHNVIEYENCSGEYLVWSGTRNHPHTTIHTFENAIVTNKGDWFQIHVSGKLPFRKKKDTRGFIVRDINGKRLNW